MHELYLNQEVVYVTLSSFKFQVTVGYINCHTIYNVNSTTVDVTVPAGPLIMSLSCVSCKRIWVKLVVVRFGLLVDLKNNFVKIGLRSWILPYVLVWKLERIGWYSTVSLIIQIDKNTSVVV